MAYSDRSTVHVRFHPDEILPTVGEIREAKGIARWNYRVMKIINVGKPDEQGYRVVKMFVERWIVA